MTLTPLGKRDDMIGANGLVRIGDTRHQTAIACNEPVSFPELTDDEAVICGLRRARSMPEELFACSSLDDMRAVYNAYYSGAYTIIEWYIGNDPGVVTVFIPQD